MGTLIYLITAALAAAAVAAELGHLHWLPDLVGHFRMPLLVVAVVGLIFALVRRPRWRALLICAAAAPHLWALFAWPQATIATTNAPARTLRVAAANLLYTNRTLERAVAWLRRIRADIVCLPEAVPHRARLRRALADIYPHHGPTESWSDTLLLSRHPIRRQRVVLPRDVLRTLGRPAPTGDGYPYHVAVVDTPAGPVTVFCLHPFPPLGEGGAAHQLLLQAVAADVRRTRGPVIALGDLNATPYAKRFRRFLGAAGLRLVGYGGLWPASWPAGGVFGVIPGLPIDHVMVSPGLQVRAARLGPEIGSDHRPLVVDLVLPPT